MKELVKTAEREWGKTVKDFDPGQTATPRKIEKYFERTGWQWFLDIHSDGTYTEKTAGHPWQSWCGLFVGYCGKMMGRHMSDDQCVDIKVTDGVIRTVLPSCDRLGSLRRWKSAGLDNIPEVKVDEIQRGDIVTVGEGRNGEHITLAREGVVDGEIRTISGNGRGLLGDGTQGEGVVKNIRDANEIARAYRLPPAAFEGHAAPQ